MPAFRFRAQAALDVRIRREEAAERALAVAQAALRAAEAATAAAAAAVEEAMARGLAGAGAATGAHELAWHRNWIVRHRQALGGCRRLEQERRAEVHLAREALMRARRERKALDKLKERAWRAYLLGETRAEQRELDLLGAIGHVRKQQAAGGEK
ncbi:MAG: flagellar export protein FliJ [Acidobacteriota bacterium]